MTAVVYPPFRKNGAEEMYHAALRAVALEAYRRITLKTPRVTGRAAGNWQISINVDPPGQVDRTLPNRGTVATEELGKLTPATVIDFPQIIISNALPYIIPLEYGHSRNQAPNGMVRVTIAELTGM